MPFFKRAALNPIAFKLFNCFLYSVNLITSCNFSWAKTLKAVADATTGDIRPAITKEEAVQIAAKASMERQH
jgi:hypothetical protein